MVTPEPAGNDDIRLIANSLRSETGDLVQEGALGFSGGLDSTILLAASSFRLHGYTVGLPGSMDIENSRSAAEIFGITIQEIVISEDDVLSYGKTVRGIDPGITPQEIGYEIVLSALLDHIKEDVLFTGQGADELFYGYRRFIDDPGMDNSGHLKKLYEVTLKREKRIADHYGKVLVTPYLNREVVRIASGKGRESHISGHRNKIILREVAASLGIPPVLYERKKKAAQYGSGVSRVIRRHNGL